MFETYCNNYTCEHCVNGVCTCETYEENGELYEFETWDCEDYEEPEPEHEWDEWDEADRYHDDMMIRRYGLDD